MYPKDMEQRICQKEKRKKKERKNYYYFDVV